MITRSAHGKSLTGGYQRSPRASAGGLADVAKKGRGGDTMLAHVNPEEAQMLEQHGGSGTVNPETGLREYWGGEGDTDYGGGAGVSAGDNYGGNAGGGYGGFGGDTGGGQESGFYSGLNPEMGPGAQPGREFIEGAQPTWGHDAMAFALGTAMPFGFDAKARPNYETGAPELSITGNPIGALANMSPLGPMGDMMSPSWADFEVASVPFGGMGDNMQSPFSDGRNDQSPPGRRDDGGESSQQPLPRWRQMADQLVRGTIGGPPPAANAPYLNAAVEG